jgi:hypothetical protein
MAAIASSSRATDSVICRGRYQIRIISCIDLLVVLMRPHVRGEGGGQGIERDLFEAIPESGLAGHRRDDRQGKEELDRSAQFGPLERVFPCRSLVACEHPGYHSVAAVQDIDRTQAGHSQCQHRGVRVLSGW